MSKPPPKTSSDELRMPASEFDDIMRRALQVKPEGKAEPAKAHEPAKAPKAPRKKKPAK